MMNNDIFLSVIVPIFNPDLKLFIKCIDSIEKIRLPIEIIIIDDGSKIKYSDSCFKYVEKNTRVKWIKKENGGVSSARNYGINKASGKYLLFLDADDEISTNFVSFLNNNYYKLNAEWVLFDVMECSRFKNEKKCRRIFSGKKISYDMNLIYDIRYDDVLDIRIRTQNLSECWGKLILRKFILDNNIEFPIGVLSGEDVIFNTRIIYYAGKIQYVPLVAYFYNYVLRLGERVLKEPYKRYEYLALGKQELENLINHRADSSKKREYFELQNIQLIRFIVQDSFILFEAGQLDKKMKNFLNEWIRRNSVLKNISIKSFSGMKLKIYYIIIKYEIWYLVRIFVKMKKLVMRIRK